MSILNRMLLSTLVASLTLASADFVHASEISEISAEEFFGATYFKNALEFPEVAKHKDRKRQIRIVERDIRWKASRLRRAIDKVEGLEGDPVELAKVAVENALAESKLKGRILDVLINADEPKHVVMYVRWRGTRRKNAIKEASTIAAKVAKVSPMVSTLSLAAIHPKAAPDSKTPVWQAKIGSSAMGSIRESRIEDYANRLYARLFEDMKALSF